MHLKLMRKSSVGNSLSGVEKAKKRKGQFKLEQGRKDNQLNHCDAAVAAVSAVALTSPIH